MGFFGFKSKKGEVLNHWIAFADSFHLPPSEFYAAVQRELENRKIPGLEITEVEHAEGGLLSDKRVYLRLLRERLAFDTCAAPFGSGFFFSCRTVFIPPVVHLWHLLVLAGGFAALYFLLIEPLGVLFATLAVVGLLLALVQMFRATVAYGLADLDGVLIKTPVLGPIYERWFRADTYFRQDTRLLYLDTIPKLVSDLAEQMTATKGVKLVRQYRCAPVLGELYKPLPAPSVSTAPPA